MLLKPTFIFLAFPLAAWAKQYTLEDDYTGQAFLDGFNVLNVEDPTHGRVNYVTANTALRQNLTFASSDTFILRADSTKVLTPEGPGRDSVRMSSKKAYGDGVWVFNIRHMPTGCGTWPALWSFSDPWPYQGEIDILEGVNDVGPNSATLHTGPNCTMEDTRAQYGTNKFNDCNGLLPGNPGCGVKLPQETSYGPKFNQNSGGWYAMEKTPNFIKVWFWPRDDPLVPLDVKYGRSNLNTDLWGLPGAFFPTNKGCSIKEKFGPQKILINLTFCGDWAGSPDVYSQSGCPATCVQHVNENPSAFKEAFFDFAWARTYSSLDCDVDVDTHFDLELQVLV